MLSIKKLPGNVRHALVVGLTAISIALIACNTSQPISPTVSPETTSRGTPITEVIQPSDVELVNQHGEAFRFSDYQGHPVLMFFGYTHCPDFCPFTLSTWLQVKQALGEEADNIRYVFITLDPERDDEATLTRHLAHFSPDFIGLTGSKANLEQLYEDFDVFYQKVGDTGSAIGYLMSHSVYIYLLDEQGYARFEYSFQDGPEAMVNDIHQLAGNKLSAAR